MQISYTVNQFSCTTLNSFYWLHSCINSKRVHIVINNYQILLYYCLIIHIVSSQNRLCVSGRQPYRIGMYGPLHVLLPAHGVGLPHDEVTIAEALHNFAGYTTGFVGKWHLGGVSNFIYCLFSIFLFVMSA